MKVTKNKKTVEMAKRFTDIKVLMKHLAEEEAQIKKDLKALMRDMDTNVLIADQFAIALTDRYRMDLDKQILEELLGNSLKEAFVKTHYQIFEIKKS